MTKARKTLVIGLLTACAQVIAPTMTAGTLSAHDGVYQSRYSRCCAQPRCDEECRSGVSGMGYAFIGASALGIGTLTGLIGGWVIGEIRTNGRDGLNGDDGINFGQPAHDGMPGDMGNTGGMAQNGLTPFVGSARDGISGMAGLMGRSPDDEGILFTHDGMAGTAGMAGMAGTDGKVGMDGLTPFVGSANDGTDGMMGINGGVVPPPPPPTARYNQSNGASVRPTAEKGTVQFIFVREDDPQGAKWKGQVTGPDNKVLTTQLIGNSAAGEPVPLKTGARAAAGDYTISFVKGTTQGDKPIKGYVAVFEGDSTTPSATFDASSADSTGGKEIQFSYSHQ